MSERKPRREGTVIKHVDLRVAGTLVRRVPLRLKTKTDRYSSRQDQFEYIIDIDEPAKVYVHHPDPNEVCKLAVAELEKALAIDWRRVYLVQVTGLEYQWQRETAEQSPSEAKLEIEFKEFEVGLRAGKPVYRSVSEGYSHVSEGAPIDRRDNKPGVSYAMVPATDVTRAKLEALVAATHELRNRIAEFMRPETIEKTLADMRVLALPMPKDVATAVEPVRDRKVKTRSKR